MKTRVRFFVLIDEATSVIKREIEKNLLGRKLQVETRSAECNALGDYFSILI